VPSGVPADQGTTIAAWLNDAVPYGRQKRGADGGPDGKKEKAIMSVHGGAITVKGAGEGALILSLERYHSTARMFPLVLP
jgi:hypothetical protein